MATPSSSTMVAVAAPSATPALPTALSTKLNVLLVASSAVLATVATVTTLVVSPAPKVKGVDGTAPKSAGLVAVPGAVAYVPVTDSVVSPDRVMVKLAVPPSATLMSATESCGGLASSSVSVATPVASAA